MELWKDIKDYEGLYQVSNFGNVKRVEGFVTRKDGRTRKVKETILKPTTNNKGYLCVQLCKDGKGKLCTIHRLVALAFIENPFNLPVVNHIDSNQLNNRLDNLEWTTAQGNTVHSIEQGRFVKLAGNTSYPENHPKLEKARKLIEEGFSMREVSKQLHICRNVLTKHGIKSNHGLVKNHDRDINAARNIRDEGLRILAVGHTASACGQRVRPSKGTAFARHLPVNKESPSL